MPIFYNSRQQTCQFQNLQNLFYLIQFSYISIKRLSKMFNPKERLQQMRKNKIVKEEASSFLAENNNPIPLFPQSKPAIEPNSQLLARLARLQNTVNQLSGQLKSSNETVYTLKKQKSDLQTKLLRLEYENSQLKVSSRVQDQKPEKPEYSQGRFQSRQASDLKKTQSQIVPQEPLMSQVEQALQQIKKQPVENILKRMEHNFRALKADPRQIAVGNKHLKEFATICKDYNRTLKKPILVLKLSTSDFD